MQAALSVCSAEVSEARNGQKRVENKVHNDLPYPVGKVQNILAA